MIDTDLLTALDPSLPVNRLQPVVTSRVRDGLLEFSEKQIIKGFKFGVLYAREDQTKEDEMFSNGTPCLSLSLSRSLARACLCLGGAANARPTDRNSRNLARV